ncbi:MAG: hypothetical protein MUC81_02375 [Bacteroidia bacterium]|jgi:hypothetical protein|nr:hypothetical protein [Bacteroidia bacterium]
MKEVRIAKINDIINFGKHLGEEIKDVALTDPDYIEWLCKEVNNFIISEEAIDALSEYCLSIFFNDPEFYLAQTGSHTTLVSYQHLKLGDKEMILGAKSNNSMLEKIKGLPLSCSYQAFSRKVFNGDNCKALLKKRMTLELSEFEEGDYDATDDFDYEDLRRSNNDAYEVDSNEFNGWHEPID